MIILRVSYNISLGMYTPRGPHSACKIREPHDDTLYRPTKYMNIREIDRLLIFDASFKSRMNFSIFERDYTCSDFSVF